MRSSGRSGNSRTRKACGFSPTTLPSTSIFASAGLAGSPSARAMSETSELPALPPSSMEALVNSPSRAATRLTCTFIGASVDRCIDRLTPSGRPNRSATTRKLSALAACRREIDPARGLVVQTARCGPCRSTPARSMRRNRVARHRACRPAARSAHRACRGECWEAEARRRAASRAGRCREARRTRSCRRRPLRWRLRPASRTARAILRPSPRANRAGRCRD